MTDHLSALRLFVRVADKGSLSAAGRDLGIPQATASRMIAGLERRIGVDLLARTTRTVRVTDAGTDFLERIRPILASLDEAERIAGGATDLRGLLRVLAPPGFIVRVMLPKLATFLPLHPGLDIEFLSDRLEEDADLWLRYADGTGLDTGAPKISSNVRIAVASPVYLAAAGAPAAPADLACHRIVSGPFHDGRDWLLRKSGKGVSVRVGGRLETSSDAVAVAAVISGAGIAAATQDACGEELKSGELVQILPEWDFGRVDVIAGYAAKSPSSLAARSLAGFLAER